MNEKEISEVRRVYAQAERDLISRIANRLEKDKTATIAQWEVMKLRELRTMNRGIETQIVKKLRNFNEKELGKLIEKAYKEGSDKTVASLNKVMSASDVKSKLINSDIETIEALTKAYKNNMNSTLNRIIRQTDDVYRQAVRKGVEYTTTGAGTRLEGAQKVINEFANRGVSGFRDSAGRSWNLNTYAEMATRTTVSNAQVEGNINRLKQNDINLGVVSAHAESCPICDPWEGQVLALNDAAQRETDYPTVADAKNAGLWHPNCSHNLTAYIPGLTEKPEPVEGKETYEDRQQQRYLERGTRKWKRRKNGAMTDKEKRIADAKVSEWQERLREFTDETGRRRKYGREAIEQAR